MSEPSNWALRKLAEAQAEAAHLRRVLEQVKATEPADHIRQVEADRDAAWQANELLRAEVERLRGEVLKWRQGVHDLMGVEDALTAERDEARWVVAVLLEAGTEGFDRGAFPWISRPLAEGPPSVREHKDRLRAERDAADLALAEPATQEEQALLSEAAGSHTVRRTHQRRAQGTIRYVPVEDRTVECGRCRAVVTDTGRDDHTAWHLRHDQDPEQASEGQT